MFLYVYLKFLMKGINVILDSLDEMYLVLADCASNVGSYKKGIEARENSKHFVRVFCSAQLVTEVSRDSGLNSIDSLLVPLNSGIPRILTLLRNIQAVHFLYIFICQIDFLKATL